MEQELVKVKCDSMSNIHLEKNHIFHTRIKHIDVWYRFVREALEEGHSMVEKLDIKRIRSTC